MNIFFNTEELYLNGNNLTGSVDALCGIDFEWFAANTCGQDDEINCTCCSACCDLPPSTYCHWIILDTLDAFLSVVGSVSKEGLNDTDSPQFKALNWIMNKDPANTTVGITTNETIEQRYDTAVLYFVLDGENRINKYNFLSEDDICSWNQESLGMLCDSARLSTS